MLGACARSIKMQRREVCKYTVSTMSLNDRCLGCGCMTSVGNRRMLGSDASRSILPLWEKVLDLELQRCGKGVDKKTLIGDGHNSKTCGCICRTCFRNFEKYEATLAENMRKAIATMPTLDACSTTTGTVRQKRGREDGESSGDKRPRLESAGADVSVRSKPKRLHPKVATSTSVSPTIAVSSIHNVQCLRCFYHQCLLSLNGAVIVFNSCFA